MKTIPSALLLALALGCGGSTSSKLPDPGRPYTIDEVYPANATPAEPSEADEQDDTPARDARVLGELAWQNSIILFEFIEAGPGEEFGIELIRSGPSAEVRALSLLDANAAYTASPAEIWLALTREPLPDDLAIDHQHIARDQGRPSADYQELLDPSVAPIVPPPPTDTLVQKSALQEGVFGTNNAAEFRVLPARPTNHCWAHARTRGVLVNAPNSSNLDFEAYVCYHPAPETLVVENFFSPGTAFFHYGNVPITSGSAFAGKGLTHVAMSYETGTSLPVKRTCSRIGTGAWNCSAALVTRQGDVTTSDINSSTSHRHAVGVLNTDLNPLILLNFGVGHDAIGVPTFEHQTSCAAFVP